MKQAVHPSRWRLRHLNPEDGKKRSMSVALPTGPECPDYSMSTRALRSLWMESDVQEEPTTAGHLSQILDSLHRQKKETDSITGVNSDCRKTLELWKIRYEAALGRFKHSAVPVERSSRIAAPELSLRDQFAMAALSGLMMHSGSPVFSPQGAANMSYEMADCMLAERNRKEN